MPENKMQKRQTPSGLDYFKNLERKNEGPETKEHAELSSVLTKPKQNKKNDKTRNKHQNKQDKQVPS